MEVARFIHVLGAVVWVGGMFFAYMALRPAAGALLQPPQRLPLWGETFRRFFFWVWVSIAGIALSGLWMILSMGGMHAFGIHVHLMIASGVVMMGIFMHVYFAPYGRLVDQVAQQDWLAAGASLGQIRKLVAVNLALGVITVAFGTLGRMMG